MDKLQVLVAGSRAAKDLIYELQSELRDVAHVTVTPEVGGGAEYISELVRVLDGSDFGIVVFPPMGKAHNQGVGSSSEFVALGICIGKLGKERTLAVAPTEPQVPSELTAVTLVSYNRADLDHWPTVAPIVFQVRLAIERQSARPVAALQRLQKREVVNQVMADIFLSYSSADREFAKGLAAALQEEGFSVWWDRTIPPGKSFDEVIEAALTTAKCVIVLWTETSADSDWVKNEARVGQRRHILVPTSISDIVIPFEFQHIQAADLAGWPSPNHAGFQSLVASVSAIIGKSKPAAGASAGQP